MGYEFLTALYNRPLRDTVVRVLYVLMWVAMICAVVVAFTDILSAQRVEHFGQPGLSPDLSHCHEGVLPECFTAIGPPVPPELCEKALADCRAGTYKKQSLKARKVGRAASGRPAAKVEFMGSSINGGFVTTRTGWDLPKTVCEMDMVGVDVKRLSSGRLEVCITIEGVK